MTSNTCLIVEKIFSSTIGIQANKLKKNNTEYNNAIIVIDLKSIDFEKIPRTICQSLPLLLVFHPFTNIRYQRT